jgi:hypothetical protein
LALKSGVNPRRFVISVFLLIGAEYTLTHCPISQDHLSLQEGKQPAGALIKHQHGAVAVLQVGRVDHRRQDQAKGIDQEMALLAFDLLTRIIAWRVDRDPPYSALFTLWLSIAPAAGEASEKHRALGLYCIGLKQPKRKSCCQCRRYFRLNFLLFQPNVRIQ